MESIYILVIKILTKSIYYTTLVNILKFAKKFRKQCNFLTIYLSSETHLRNVYVYLLEQWKYLNVLHNRYKSFNVRDKAAVIVLLERKRRPWRRVSFCEARQRKGEGDKRFPCLTKYRLRAISPTVTTSARFSAPAAVLRRYSRVCCGSRELSNADLLLFTLQDDLPVLKLTPGEPDGLVYSMLSPLTRSLISLEVVYLFYFLF